jgi:hypothetical protein
MMFKVSRNTKILIPILMLVSFVAAFNEAQAINTLRTKKFRMPGKYEVFLKRGDYILWILNRWKSAGIDQKPGSSEYRLVNSAAKEIKCEPCTDRLSQRNNEREGWQECALEIEIDGIYQLEATSPEMKGFVVALVPRESHYLDFGSSTVLIGMYDAHFEPTTTSQIESFLFQSKGEHSFR